ncbi:MAG: thioredoxin [Clostridia bacterium]|nr:thioredoxin [Clostridia bacterium]
MEIKNISSEEEFKTEIAADVPVLVDFWATWCNPCKMQSPILHEFAEEMGDKIKVIKVDVDEISSLCYEYSVASIPTLMVFKKGELLDKTVGLTTKAGLSELIIKYL